MKIYNQNKIRNLIIISLILTGSLVFSFFKFDSNLVAVDNINENVPINEEPKLNAPISNYVWWNETWEFRITVDISANGATQNNVPVELKMNFTNYLKDLDIINTELDTESIRVIEYTSISNYIEIACEFHPYVKSFDNETNAIGDVVWIVNGTTGASETRNYLIYFNNNETKVKVPAPNYPTIREWHEGFEEMEKTDGLILSACGTSQDRTPDLYDISTDVSSRGDRSLWIWGNNWKAQDIGYLVNRDSNTFVTVKMRIDDPSKPAIRDISGIAFDDQYAGLPSTTSTYEMRGWQNWGRADAPAPYGPYDDNNNYYSDETFYWYTLDLYNEISELNFRYIMFVADFDNFQGYDLYWDDISIWKQQVQTDPAYMPLISVGELETIAFTLKITCLDEEGNRIQNAHVFISNELNPLENQNSTTDENGEWLFTEIKEDLDYNITINYTQNGLLTPKTDTVYFKENYTINTLNNYLNAYANLTTIYFNVTDYDGDPIQYGNVVLKNIGNNDVGKGVLDNAGNCTIIWKNNTDYNYLTYFDFTSLPDPASYRNISLEISNGSVNIDTHMVDVMVNFSKVIFNVTQETDGTPFVAATVRIYNKADFRDEVKILANISVQSDGSARFFGFNNETVGVSGNYTMEIYFAGLERPFSENGVPIALYADGSAFNFTLHKQSFFNISINLDMSRYNTTINLEGISTDINWGDMVTIDFNFTTQDPSSPAETLESPTELYFQILDDEQGPYSNKVSILSSMSSPGIFSYLFNTTEYSLIGGYDYWIEITGNYKSYVAPESLEERIEVKALPTGIRFFDYSLNELTDKRISVIFKEMLSVSVDYFETGTENPLRNALVTYTWDYGSGILVDDPIHPDLYYFEFNSSQAPDDAEYIIDIRATLTNYSTITDSIIVNILSRPTSINGITSLFQFSPDVYVLETVNYTFEYKDIIQDLVIGDLDIAGYNWYRLDEDGNPLTGLGNEGSGYLTQSVNNLYTLDFNTELREVGEYSIFITLQKSNYEVRNAFISLTISKRPISVDLAATGLSGNRINVIQGDNINIRITLYDPTNGSQLLTNANVTLNLGGSFNEITAGVYEYDYSTANIDAFFTPKTLTGQITIEKENYEEISISITIVVGMNEIFPGFPLLYFILIIGGIAAIVGSLVTYRVIQQARIPTFVKKVKKMKKDIKSKKTISDSLLYPSKDEYIVKQLGDRWDMLGLSLKKVLGIEGNKKKKIPETTGDLKGGGA